MRTVVVVAVLVLAMCACGFAQTAEWSSFNFYNWAHPTSQTTRGNIEIKVLDVNQQKIHQPGTPIKAWIHIDPNVTGCGIATTTFTLKTVNGQVLVMNKFLDYTFLVPTMEQWWTLDINANISDTNIRNCFQIGIYGDTDQQLPVLVP